MLIFVIYCIVMKNGFYDISTHVTFWSFLNMTNVCDVPYVLENKVYCLLPVCNVLYPSKDLPPPLCCLDFLNPYLFFVILICVVVSGFSYY